LNGDSFLRAPLDDVAGFFEEGLFDAVVTTYDNGLKSGLEKTPVPNNLKVRNQIVVEYLKGAGIENGFERVDSGIYIVKKALFAAGDLANQAKFQLEDILNPLIAKRTYGGFTVDQRFYDIGTTERLQEFENYVHNERKAGRLHGREPEGVR
jgi:NDP-sugar pyrophosphorylase family protein